MPTRKQKMAPRVPLSSDSGVRCEAPLWLWRCGAQADVVEMRQGAVPARLVRLQVDVVRTTVRRHLTTNTRAPHHVGRCTPHQTQGLPGGQGRVSHTASSANQKRSTTPFSSSSPPRPLSHALSRSPHRLLPVRWQRRHVGLDNGLQLGKKREKEKKKKKKRAAYSKTHDQPHHRPGPFLTASCQWGGSGATLVCTMGCCSWPG
jgi:hypothetical protein